MDNINDYSLLGPSYSVYALGQIYKVVKFKNTVINPTFRDSSSFQSYDSKLDQSLSRTRRLILEKALCNHWDWFCTFTIDSTKYDRYSLKSFYKALSVFLMHINSRVTSIKYLLVPEMHSDGAWHMHGLFQGNPDLISFRHFRMLGYKVPNSLVNAGFYTWPAYHDKFGFCSFGKLRSSVASAFYVSKYITKDNASLVSDLGSKLYYCSQGLNTAIKHGDSIYGNCSSLDRFLTMDYDFVKVGYTRLSDGLDWTFAQNFMDLPDDCFDDVFCDDGLTGNFFDDMCSLNYEQMSLYNTGREQFINIMRGEVYND